MKKYGLCISIFACTCFQVTAQQTDSVFFLLNRIAAQQVQQDAFFIQNSFPSYISNRQQFDTRKKDNNVFYTALVNYTLISLQQKLTPAAQLIFDTIYRRSASVYPKFKNTNGRKTYNFWRTDSSYIFPYTNWIHRLKKNTALPDDMDDTVLSLLATNTDSTTAAAVHQLMQHYTNNDKLNAQSISRKYRSYKAYSVWYGKNFPAVFDVCVLSNVLSFVQQYNLAWGAADSASLQVIIKAVTSGDYITKPLEVSPYYGNTSIILYHLARLMSIRAIPQLDAYKIILIAEAAKQFAHTDNILEKIILCSAIFKWGYIPPPFNMPDIMTIEHSNLPFFIGNIPSYFRYFIKQLFTQKQIGLFYHYCPAYNDALLVEYLLLKQTAF